MTSETCAKCGHKNNFLKSYCERCGEKFKPQNHSPHLLAGDEVDRCQSSHLEDKPTKTEDTEPSSNNEGGSDDASSLSDKIHWIAGDEDHKLLMIRDEEVKESVQKLKEAVKISTFERNHGHTRSNYHKKLIKNIDKIFGNQLNGSALI